MSQLTVRNEISELERVNAWLTSLPEFRQLTETNAHHLLFAVEELFVNIVRHAFDDEAEHHIVLQISSSQGTPQLAIIDDGRPFDPTQRARPNHDLPLERRVAGGEGIHISRELMSDMMYVRSDDRNHLILSLPVTT